MNGFKVHYLFFLSIIAFFCISCSKNIKELQGEALFFVYKFVPETLNRGVEIWLSPKKFQKEDVVSSTNALHQIFFDTIHSNSNYIVLRFGSKISPKDTFIDRIEYQNRGTSITLTLYPVDEALGRTSDRGFPVFVVDKKIHQIIFKEKHKVIFITNINR